MGNSDGTQGYAQSYISNHVEACSKFGIMPDQAAWLSDWQTGIRAHCTPSNGLNRGKAGRSNVNSCPADLASGYNEGHSIGRAVYNAKTARDRVKREIDADIAALANLTVEERSTKQIQIELKRNRLFELQNELNRAEARANSFEFRGTNFTR